MSSFSRTDSGSSEKLFNKQNVSNRPPGPTTLDKKSSSSSSGQASTTPQHTTSQTTHQPTISYHSCSPLQTSFPANPQTGLTTHASHSNQPQQVASSNKPTLNPQQASQFKMSISPSLSSANSNQSSAASSANSLIDNQEELTNLTNFVKLFREQLSKLRRIVSNEINQRREESSKESSSIKDLINKDLYQGLSGERSAASKDQAAKDETSKEQTDRQEILKAQVQDKLADVLRILKIVFERWSNIQSSDLFISCKNLIESVKGFQYNDPTADLNELLDRIDQLAVSFSNRVSEYLMEGGSSAQQKAKLSAAFESSNKYVCDSNNNLNPQTQSSNAALANSEFPDIWNSVYNMFHTQFHKRVFTDANRKEDFDCNQGQLSSDECDEIIQRMNSSVEFALANAKLWSSYIKNVTIYVEKRIGYEMENSKNLLKLAQTMKPILKESDNLPLQQLYLNMLDLDIKNHKAYFANCSLVLGHKFLEPLTVLRNENEKCRKACKNQWSREYKKLQDSVGNLKKARSTYIAKKLELDRAKQALKTVLETGSITSSFSSSGVNQSIQPNSSSSSSYITATNFGQSLIQMETTSEQMKLDKKRKYEEDCAQKAVDAEHSYRNAVIDANERARTCENIKKTILNRIKDLDYKSDLSLTQVTGNYLQIQKLVTAAEPVDFQQLQKEVESYSFGSTNLSDYLAKLRDSNQAILNCFTFVPYETTNSGELCQHPVSMSFERNSDYESQTESMDFDALAQSSSNPDNRSSNLNSSTSNTKLGNLTKHESMMTGEDLNADAATASTSRADSFTGEQTHHQISKKQKYRKSKVAASHHFRTVRTLSKCKECDVMNFNFQGLECVQCGICVHKKCVETLIIKCGLKPLTKRTNIFTLDLCNQSANNEVPFLVKKCIQEINRRGLGINGLYRVSGVKSQVEKLCADFEIGGDLVDLATISPTVLTSVLKFYFRALPIPLLTYRLYNDFIQIGKRYPNVKADPNTSDELVNSSSSQSLLKELRHVINKLPETHLNTLDYLMKHLKKVADNETNNMPANNLGIVFGPTLLRANESATSLSTLVDTVHQNRVIELLIINYNELFGGNLVEDDDAEFDEIIEELKTIAVDDESENEEDETNPEIQLDNLIQDLNKSEFMSSSSNKDYRQDYSTQTQTASTSTKHLHHLQSKDSEDFYYLKNQNSMERTTNELKLSSKHYAARPSLHELRKQFFTETSSTTSPFQSFGTSDDLADKRSLNSEQLQESGYRTQNRSLDARGGQEQSTQSKSPSASTLQLFKSKDEQRERYV